MPFAIIISTSMFCLVLMHLGDRLGAGLDRLADAIRDHARARKS